MRCAWASSEGNINGGMMETVLFIITSDPAIMAVSKADTRRSDTRTRLSRLRLVLGGDDVRSEPAPSGSPRVSEATLQIPRTVVSLKYISKAYCATDDVSCYSCAPVMSMRGDVELVDMLNANRLADRTEHMAQSVTAYLARLPNRSLVVASAELVRILGRHDVNDGALYVVRFVDGIPSLIVHLGGDVTAEEVEAMLSGDVRVKANGAPEA